MSHTFSCALQTVDVDGVPVRFEADPQDYHICRMWIGDVVVSFNRNGAAIEWHREEEPAPDEPTPEEAPPPRDDRSPDAVAADGAEEGA